MLLIYIILKGILLKNMFVNNGYIFIINYIFYINFFNYIFIIKKIMLLFKDKEYKNIIFIIHNNDNIIYIHNILKRFFQINLFYI